MRDLRICVSRRRAIASEPHGMTISTTPPPEDESQHTGLHFPYDLLDEVLSNMRHAAESKSALRMRRP